MMVHIMFAHLSKLNIIVLKGYAMESHFKATVFPLWYCTFCLLIDQEKWIFLSPSKPGVRTRLLYDAMKLKQ